MSRPELSLATEYTIQENKPNYITLLTEDSIANCFGIHWSLYWPRQHFSPHPVPIQWSIELLGGVKLCRLWGVWLLCWQLSRCGAFIPSLLSWLCLIREPIIAWPSPAQSEPQWSHIRAVFIVISCYQGAQSPGLSGWNVVRRCSQSEASISQDWPMRGRVIWPECCVVMPPIIALISRNAQSKSGSPESLRSDRNMTQISAFGKHQLQIKKHHQSVPGINS